MRRAGLWLALAWLACLVGPPVLGLPRVAIGVAGPGAARRGGGMMQGGGMLGQPGGAAGLRLRGGLDKDEEDSEEETAAKEKWKGKPGLVVAGGGEAAEPEAKEGPGGGLAGQSPSTEEAGGGDVAEGGGAAEAEAEKPAAPARRMPEPEPEEEEEEAKERTPEQIQEFNRVLWEASLMGNEPGAANAIKEGANVNAFCRGPDEWKNIEYGDFAGAGDNNEYNMGCFQLNNYTALHLAIAGGNPSIVNLLLDAGANINAEALYRIHPMPNPIFKGLPFLGKHCPCPNPLVYRITPLRIAKVVSTGRVFYTSYHRCYDVVEKRGAYEYSWAFPIITYGLLLAYWGAVAGFNRWPYNWFSDWPDQLGEWEYYCDFVKDEPQRGPDPTTDPPENPYVYPESDFPNPDQAYTIGSEDRYQHLFPFVKRK